MRPLVAYHGGKSRLAEWIVSLMPRHRVYLEPFAGSAAVLLAKPQSIHELLNDVDGNLVTFFRMLRDRPADLERICRLTPYARDEFLAADLKDPTIEDLERARRWWIRTTQGFGAITRAENGWKISTRRGGADAGAVLNNISRFAAVADRLSRVAIENRNALELIEIHGHADAVIYADPPYLASARNANADGYAHEFRTDEDHRQLAELLGKSSATVLLSGYDSPLYDELYDGWYRAARRVLRKSSNGSGGGQVHVNEVIWSNRPLAEDLFSGTGALA